jgi:hypothetical protein
MAGAEADTVCEERGRVGLNQPAEEDEERENGDGAIVLPTPESVDDFGRYADRIDRP